MEFLNQMIKVVLNLHIEDLYLNIDNCSLDYYFKTWSFHIVNFQMNKCLYGIDKIYVRKNMK
jgi:hypothetical protein